MRHGIEANEARSRELVEKSLVRVTALAPLIGYDAAAAIAHEAVATDKTVREVARLKTALRSSKSKQLWTDGV
jgi:fumarate hydratase, class II